MIADPGRYIIECNSVDHLCFGARPVHSRLQFLRRRNMADGDIYLTRWQALENLLVSLEDTYTTGHQFDESKTVVHLVRNLRAFGQGQFGLFFYGFDENRPDWCPQLQRWDEFPPEDLWTGILEQIQNDIELIQKVAAQ